MIIPWIKIEAMKTTVPEVFQAYPEFLWNMNSAAIVATAPVETTFAIAWEYALLFGGMFLATLFFGYKLYQIYALKRKGEVQYFKDFTQIIVANSAIAFSFFRSIFLGDKVIQKEHHNILQHELVHIRQRHSYDLIFFELMRIVGWFNPLVYVYQSRVSELHEFIADDHVAKTDKKEQYQLLLSEVFQTQHISFINQFFKSSLIKKRIIMLSKTKSKKIWQLKYLLLVPMVLGMLFYTSCKNEEGKIPENTVFVDDLASLSVEEESLVFNKLNRLSGSGEDWQLFVKDKNSSLRYQNSKDGSYLNGPKGEKILAKVGVDSRLRKGVTFNESNTMLMIKQHLLIKERIELRKTLKNDDPILIELNLKIQDVNDEMQLQLDNHNAFNGFFPLEEIHEVPVFPGCESSNDKRECFKERLADHIEKNLKSNKNNKIKDKILVTFAISEFGHNEVIKIRGGNKDLQAEVIKVIKLLPQMQPGRWDGDNFSTFYTIPISFN